MIATSPSVSPATFARLVERHPARYPALFESVARHPKIGRRSLLFGFPGSPIVARPGRNFFDELDCARRESCGFGHVVFLGYELLTHIDKLSIPAAPGPLPSGFLVPVAAAAVLDHQTGRIEFHGDAGAVRAIEDDLRAWSGTSDAAPPPIVRSVEEDRPETYLRAVRRAKDYITAGDIYQANLAREWRATLERDVGPLDVYRKLRAHNPAPFAGVIRFENAAIVSSSPERLLCAQGNVLESRPIAGTRPRLPGGDQSAIDALLASEKERAEHIMLVDLVRNDLGKVARFGSVRVDELMAIESYAHVHHIVSNVRCIAREGVASGQALAALFPGGTITGCPKIRCMEVIAELEGVGRGAYTGSMGYVTAEGDMDFNILIRTIEFEPGRISFRAGAGIVADSDPEYELAETKAKALGLLRALAG